MTNRFASLIALLFVLTMGACQENDTQIIPETEASTPDDLNSDFEDDSVDIFETLLRANLDYARRLENVSYGILKANIAACPETQRSIGIKVHTIYDYPSELQMHARVFLDLDTALRIRMVATGSPAETSGLKVGDRIVSLGGETIPTGENAGDVYQALSRNEYSLGSVSMEIERQGEIITVNLAPDTICGYSAQLFYDDIVNAHTDGSDIWVTTELLRIIDEDVSLALIVAHELAHAVKGHIFLEPTPALELEADRLSLFYLARAGYDPEEAVRLWQSNPLNFEMDLSNSHPSRQERLDVLQQALRDLRSTDP